MLLTLSGSLSRGERFETKKENGEPFLGVVMKRGCDYQRAGAHFSLSAVFYTREHIHGAFHDGSDVSYGNIREEWKLHVTQAPSGQWLTMNNRMLFAYNSLRYADGEADGGDKHIQDILLEMEKVQVVPYSEARSILESLDTPQDNGNTCYVLGDPYREDWICSDLVDPEAYYKYVLEYPSLEQEKVEYPGLEQEEEEYSTFEQEEEEDSTFEEEEEEYTTFEHEEEEEEKFKFLFLFILPSLLLRRMLGACVYGEEFE
ncbi:expressed unknown protein [Seminavis robusta]|uniref:Uncharacterized protein n=1 Tax=Seminavis robusta TaxID=568900 RepID=A0A9N8DQ16_9STRA|nr:expressed unknown protein [Seminavis robusta]|eukprot:Sro207_g086830.1 n/a (259) ;mRNA; r:38618-39394